MLLNAKLRREQAKLLTLKNNEIWFKIIILSIVFWGAMLIAPFSLHGEETDFNQESGHILYDTFGGANNLLNVEKFEREDAEIYLHKPYRNGYLFEGWYLDRYYTKPIVRIDCNQTGNYILYAKWESLNNNYDHVSNYPYESTGKIKNKVKNKTDVRLLKDLEYSFLEELNIPGMPRTKEQDFLSSMIFSTDQVPQGFTFTDSYIFVSSYSSEEGKKGGLMVFDRDSYEYLITIAMDENSHLGGIAFDGSNLWVCNSENMTIERISYDFIQLMVERNRGKVVDATTIVDSYSVKYSPSCITYHDGIIWIATHHKVFDSKMVAYYYDSGKDKLDRMNSYDIPAKVQGIVFDGENHVILSTSYGRNASSYLKVYDSVIAMATNPNKPTFMVEMPPGSEEIDMDSEGQLFVIFETAGEKYYLGTDGHGVSRYPLDQILLIPKPWGQIFAI